MVSHWNRFLAACLLSASPGLAYAQSLQGPATAAEMVESRIDALEAEIQAARVRTQSMLAAQDSAGAIERFPEVRPASMTVRPIDAGETPQRAVRAERFQLPDSPEAANPAPITDEPAATGRWKPRGLADLRSSQTRSTEKPKAVVPTTPVAPITPTPAVTPTKTLPPAETTAPAATVTPVVPTTAAANVATPAPVEPVAEAAPVAEKHSPSTPRIRRAMQPDELPPTPPGSLRSISLTRPAAPVRPAPVAETPQKETPEKPAPQEPAKASETPPPPAVPLKQIDRIEQVLRNRLSNGQSVTGEPAQPNRNSASTSPASATNAPTTRQTSIQPTSAVHKTVSSRSEADEENWDDVSLDPPQRTSAASRQSPNARVVTGNASAPVTAASSTEERPAADVNAKIADSSSSPSANLLPSQAGMPASSPVPKSPPDDSAESEAASRRDRQDRLAAALQEARSHQPSGIQTVSGSGMTSTATTASESDASAGKNAPSAPPLDAPSIHKPAQSPARSSGSLAPRHTESCEPRHSRGTLMTSPFADALRETSATAYGGFDVLFLKPSFATSDAIVVDTAGNRDIQSFDYDFEFSPRAIAGLVFESGFGLRFQYFQFDHAFGAQAGPATAAPGSLSTPAISGTGLTLASNAAGQSLSADHSLLLQTWDLEATQQFTAGSLGVTFGGGVRYLEMEQLYDVQRLDANGLLSGSLRHEHDFSGFGPTIATEVLWPFQSEGLSLYMTGRASIAFGSKNQSVVRFDQTGLARMDREDQAAHIGVGEVGIGLQYLMGGATLRLGYEGQVWSDVGSPTSTTGTLGLQGLAASIGLAF